MFYYKIIISLLFIFSLGKVALAKSRNEMSLNDIDHRAVQCETERLKKKIILEINIDSIYIEENVFAPKIRYSKKIKFESDTISINEFYAFKIVIPRYQDDKGSEYRIRMEFYRVKNNWAHIFIPRMSTEEWIPYNDRICSFCEVADVNGKIVFWMKGGIKIH